MPPAGRILLLLSLAICLLAAASAAQAAQAGRSYGESVRALQQKDWQKAEKKIREALRDEPQALDSILISGSTRYPYLPYYVLGAALYGRGDCAGALDAWRESLRQGVIRNSANELKALEAGMTDCGARVAQAPESPQAAEPPAAEAQEQPAPDPRFEGLTRVVADELESLDAANSRFARLASDPDLSAEWTANWKPRLDESERERLRLTSSYEAAIAGGDIDALDTVAGDVDAAAARIEAHRLAAQDRIGKLRDERVAQAAARDAERKRQEALEEQRRLAAIREREEAEKRRLEIEARERLATAQRSLQDALGAVPASASRAAQDAQVEGVRRALQDQVTSARSLVASTDVGKIDQQVQALRDSARRYNQAVQEWEATQREIALRTPPPALSDIARAYFSGDYDEVARVSRPGDFRERREVIQSYLFRSAANFNLYWLGGGERQELLQSAREDVRQIKRLNPDFAPYVAAFSPRYLRFFEDS